MHVWTRVKHELTGRRLLWNLFFYVGHLLIFVYGWIKQAHDARLAGLNSLRYSVWISRGAGLCLGVDGLLIVLPVLRNCIRIARPLIGWAVPLDENLWCHRQFAYSLLFWTIVHTTAHYVNMINVERTQIRKETAWAILFTQPGGFTGHVMLLLMLLMFSTAHAKIRKQAYEAFWYTHHLAVLFLLGLYVHAVGCFVRGALPDQPVRCLGYNTWTWTIWGGVALFVERLTREIRARRRTLLIGVLLHPQGALELRFVKPSFSYKAGQWVYLNLPELSRFQWHPFTISSAPDDPCVSVHIRQVGDWTQALAARLGCTPEVAASLSTSGHRRSTFFPLDLDAGKGDEGRSPTSDFYDVTLTALTAGGKLPVIRVDGPYGAPAQDVFKAEVAILVGAGIGVTPFASVLKNVWYMEQQNKLGALRRVVLVWIVRDTANMGWFAALLRQLEQAQKDPDFLSIRLYLTQRVSPAMLTHLAVHAPGASGAHTGERPRDAITGLAAPTHFGRPDFDALLRRVRDGVETGSYLPGRESSLRTTVGVFYCGPNGLAKELKDKTKRAGSKAVRFTFRKEHFVSRACRHSRGPGC
ncbi:NADPH oxidase [Rhodotorula diobovata]|uniref:NADPH oxidase n=1 Tax=Rhodotorula diobovata TaxID=5288 RepID=A0A5C5FQU1_9BASI|nr:NADPH oxidase [Rhodotorula diobovata]